MSDIEKMKEVITRWGLTSQVLDLYNAGFTMVKAIRCVYLAHARKG